MVQMADKPILVLSGPNLNLLGSRQPEIYGKENLADHVQTAREAALVGGYAIEHLHSNHEGDLIDAIHHARGRTAAIIFNPGAFTHYSYALADALAAYDGVVVEVHLSNPAAREEWRRTSVITPVATGTIAGFGGAGYRLAVEAVLSLLEDSKE
jgi:3-dehydroquinate dehydratase II